MFLSIKRYAASRIEPPESALGGSASAVDAVGQESSSSLYRQALLHRRAGRNHEALQCLTEFLVAHPDNLDALETVGNILMDLGAADKALFKYDAVLNRNPNRANSLYNRGLALLRLRQSEAALGAFDALLQLHPEDAAAEVQRGNALLDLRRHEAARASYERALGLDQADADAWHNLGVVQQVLHRPMAAAAAFERALQIAPDRPLLPGKRLQARMMACDWRDLDRLLADVEQGLAAGQPSIEPFAYQGLASDEALQLVCARLAAAEYRQEPICDLATPRPRAEGGRLRVGYVSGEFRHQATAILATQLFECHDRRRFELLAFDNGWDDGSALRRRIEAAFDEIVDISHLSDREAAQEVARRGVDILVDLNGYFGHGRPGLFGWRPSPVQVGYLGFPGTSGADWLDYIVADRHVIPPEARRHYREQVVQLPHCYQANDAHRELLVCTARRSEVGLPEGGFVFCCFNNSYKITPQVFDVWMRLLRQVPGSVLWLLEDNAAAVQNLRAEAAARGIGPDRLVFAPRLDLALHLARHALADLFLDTLPCNAHTTASDALWAGLPLLTCTGTTFSGRVATSLLRTLGLAELVTATLDDYEREALRWARDPAGLAGLRMELVRRVRDPRQPLFDARGLCRDLERAYEQMWTTCQRGEPPREIILPPD